MVKPTHAITCMDVDVALEPCIPYLVGQAPDPTKTCCDGILHLKNLATTTPDRRAACTCMKAAASHLPGLKDSAVSALPQKCNAPLPYPISTSVDCTKWVSIYVLLALSSFCWLIGSELQFSLKFIVVLNVINTKDYKNDYYLVFTAQLISMICNDHNIVVGKVFETN